MQRSRGFTLLEVMLALTICAIALTSLFSVIVGSKQLTYTAQGALRESTELQGLIGLLMLVDQEGELLAPPADSDYRFRLMPDELEIPERQTSPTTEALYQYEIEDADGEVVLGGTYWVTLEEEQ